MSKEATREIRALIKRIIPTVSIRMGSGTARSWIDINGSGKWGEFTPREKTLIEMLLGNPPGYNNFVISPDDQVRILSRLKSVVPKLELRNPTLSIPVGKDFRRLRVETKLVRSTKPFPEVTITSPDKVKEAVGKIAASDRERLMALYLDTKNRLQGVQQITVGERATTLVPQDAIARGAILTNSGGVILVHNHPSGDPTPSHEDIDVARKTKASLKQLDIALLDMVVIGESGSSTSLREKGVI